MFVVLSGYLWRMNWRYRRQWQLSQAASDGNLAEVQKLVADGANIDAFPTDWDGGGSGIPALSLAAEYGHEDIVRFFLDHGANTEVCDEDTPLLLAVIKKHYSIAKLLLEHGANPNARGEGTPLYDAVGQGDLEMAKLLLLHGADPNGHLQDVTPLSAAQHEGNVKMVELLKTYGAKE